MTSASACNKNKRLRSNASQRDAPSKKLKNERDTGSNRRRTDEGTRNAPQRSPSIPVNGTPSYRSHGMNASKGKGKAPETPLSAPSLSSTSKRNRVSFTPGSQPSRTPQSASTSSVSRVVNTHSKLSSKSIALGRISKISKTFLYNMSSQTDMSVTTVETETTCYFMPTSSLKACSSLLDDHLQRDPRHVSLPRSIVPDDLPLDSIFTLMISDGVLGPLPLPNLIILARAVIALRCDTLSAPVIIRLSHFFFPGFARHVNNSPAGDKLRAENARDVLKLSFASPLFRCFSRPAIYYLLLRDLTTLSDSESVTLTHDESSFVNNNLQDLRAKFVEAEKKVLGETCPTGRCARKWRARKWTLSEMHDPIRALLWVSDGCSTCRSKWSAYCAEIWAGMDMWHA